MKTQFPIIDTLPKLPRGYNGLISDIWRIIFSLALLLSAIFYIQGAIHALQHHGSPGILLFLGAVLLFFAGVSISSSFRWFVLGKRGRMKIEDYERDVEYRHWLSRFELGWGIISPSIEDFLRQREKHPEWENFQRLMKQLNSIFDRDIHLIIETTTDPSGKVEVHCRFNWGYSRPTVGDSAQIWTTDTTEFSF